MEKLQNENKDDYVVVESLDGELYIVLGRLYIKDIYVSLKKINDLNPEYYYTEQIDNFNKSYKVTEKSRRYKDDHKKEIGKIIYDYNHM